MKALLCKKSNEYEVTDVPRPKIVQPMDVIGRVTLSAICTSDVHAVRGHVAVQQFPAIPGHEFCVEVVEVGSAVEKFKVGDRCMVAPGIDCGECAMCNAGLQVFCGHEHGGLFGGTTNLSGAQAEYIRIPWADRFMFKIPEGLTEEDVILVPDMLGTGWFGCKNARVTEGQCIAVVGLGPVGLSACLLAKKVFRAKVIAFDVLQDRLDLALKEGITDVAINANDEDAFQKFTEAAGPFGCDATIETGGNAKSFALAVRLTKPHGIVSTVAVFAEPIEIPMPDIVFKNLVINAGIQPLDSIEELLGYIVNGTIDTKFMQTHKAPLNDIMKGYEVFGNQQDGCVKWLVTPYVD